jgi:hypothetical protein
MIVRNKTARKAIYMASIARAGEFAHVHAGDTLVVAGLTPVSHVDVPGRSFEWAVLDPLVMGPSYYAGADDALDDIAKTAIKPERDLLPMAIRDWYPRFVKAVQRKIESLDAA